MPRVLGVRGQVQVEGEGKGEVGEGGEGDRGGGEEGGGVLLREDQEQVEEARRSLSSCV